jgi:membrane protease YdiL (CAAX protease family)
MTFGDRARPLVMSGFPPPSTPPVTAPAGWYRDPENAAGSRYFDGQQWAPAPSSTEAELSPRSEGQVTVPLRAGVMAVVVLLGSLLLSGVGLLIATELGIPTAIGLGLAMTIGYGPSVVWAVVSARRWGSADLLGALGVRAKWVDLGWGPLIWLVAIGVQILLGALILVTDLPTVSNTDAISNFDGRTAEMWVVIFAAVVMAPVVEELVFRGLLLRSLVRVMPAPFAILIQAVVFGVLHLNPEAGIANLGLVIILTGVGAVLGVAAHKLGRIAPTIIAHSIFNAVVMALVLSGVTEGLV